MHFEDKDDITALPCDEKHYFHSACIREWLVKDKRCPICRKPVQ